MAVYRRENKPDALVTGDGKRIEFIINAPGAQVVFNHPDKVAAEAAQTESEKPKRRKITKAERQAQDVALLQSAPAQTLEEMEAELKKLPLRGMG